jgi:oligosaccharide 4-alpha-D-glucosyltransferase
LLYNYATDTNAIKTENEYLFGDNILVAPVTKRGATVQKVYLPEGNWYDVETNKNYAGKSFTDVDVTDYKKPLFYKEGSFIPQYFSSGENTTEINRKKLKVIHVPSASKSNYDMYDDDGETKNALALNQYELIKFSSTGKTNKGLVINIQNSNGNYKGKPLERNISLTIPALDVSPKTVVVNGKPIKDFVWENEILTIAITLKNVPLKVDLKW